MFKKQKGKGNFIKRRTPKDSKLNISRKLEGGNLTNNITELTAAIEGINIIKKIESYGFNKPKTLEQMYYRDIFCKYYITCFMK